MKKLPKHRTTIYTILRLPDVAVLDSFFSFERAEEVAAFYAQDMKDRNVDGFTFPVKCSTYYDE